MFVQFSEQGQVPEAYHELFEYFQKHYKNSNKGIKGRGKTRAVAARGPQNATIQSSASSAAKSSAKTRLPRKTMSAQKAAKSTGKSSAYAMTQGSTNALSNVLRNPNPAYSLYGPQSPQAMYEMTLGRWGPQATYMKHH